MSATIRTFRAADTRAALAAVKAALGPDAVILSTRELSGGLFRPHEIEVTAAKPESVASPVAAANAYAAHAKPSSRPTHPMGGSLPPTSLRPEPAMPPQLAAPAPTELADELVSLRSLVENLRRELQASVPGRVSAKLDLSPSAADLYCKLCNVGMEDHLAEQLIRQAAQGIHGSNPAALRQNLRDVLASKLITERAPWLAQGRRIISLVGPTGVGKTTTLAKIAARALMESNQRVAMITVDTYRIGASEQVARYGQIMNVPTHVARNREELGQAIAKCSSADLVLIDTAGRSVSEAVAKQAELIRSVPAVQLYLVMSAASGGWELGRVAERYRFLNPERLVFTKIDEASGAGAILSAVDRLGAPIAAITDGQRVPEDLHAVTGPELADLISNHSTDGRHQLGAQGR